MAAWHEKSAKETYQHFSTSFDEGLSAEVAEQLLQKNGPNELPTKAAVPAWKRFLQQFNNLLIYVLIVAALLAGVLAEWLDMAVIFVVVLVNASIGFYQEGRAEKALNAIQKMLKIQCTVRRSGKNIRIPARNLVVGDIVTLDAGDKVPADLRLVSTHSVAIQEAPLTGESVAVEKASGALDNQTVLADRNNMAYFGTLVTQGRAIGVVVATGSDTELGRINRLLNKVTTITTPLIQQMAQFAKYLTLVVVGIGLLVFLLGFLRGDDPTYLFMAVVSIIVAAIPEGLPTILTVALAIGVTRLAQRKSIIRKLPAVETLGAVSTICSDKTGTLTRNEMMVAKIATGNEMWEISGSGYTKGGEFSHSKYSETNADTKLMKLLQVGVLCNDSELKEVNEAWEVVGDPMEGALIVTASKASLDYQQLFRSAPRIDSIPFDARHKYMATLHDAGFLFSGDAEPREALTSDQRIILIKGAPERVLGMVNLSENEHEQLHQQINTLAEQGMRVLGFAYKLVDSSYAKIKPENIKHDAQFLGFAGLIDPPREEAKQAIIECKKAGIQVKMITGDHLGTARAIGFQLGLQNTDDALAGADIDNLSDDELAAIIGKVNIYARTTPEHKLRLVSALQKNGAVVAMTGDGVNDAPALKRADVGIAMGLGGTEAAREASEMVLTDDNFATIVSAVKEGRTVYDNLKKAISFLLPVNGGESLAIILALLFAFTLPILPLQILWVNMVSSITLALALAFEPSEPGAMQRPPRNPLEPLISRLLLWRIIMVSILFTLGIFSVFQWALAQGFSESYARTMAVNTLVAMEVWYLFSVRYLHGKSFSLKGIRGTPSVLLAVCTVFVLQLIFTYTPFMQRLFATEGLAIEHGLICVAVGILIFAVLEFEKILRSKRSVKNI
ncbi:P-type ATPase, translocating,P-type ATPase, translocating [Idiomarina sp. A28L]|uniref:cation-translocating P-type ATPase n=1 Tax=Idiomarina sp. A28L TaxID=1036674 RepID=UPI0002138A3A|nr:HAD-IC family P-type ATPase [Idiomarina sp. A28L]EGN75024.1 P-type ATPase, translocating,P-type ATPase, translocating [Idiomarina sp. A28L]